MSCTCSPTAESFARGARSWHSSSKRKDTAGSMRQSRAEMAQALHGYIAEWKRAELRRGRGGSPALARMREDALNRFASRGFPTTREEEWRFTSVAPIAERAFALATPPRPDATGLD